MIAATWKTGTEGLHKADAQKVANEIIAIGESATPAQIVDRAKDPESELHKCFEWSNATAAEKWRIYQARQIVCHLVIRRTEEERAENKPEIRLLHKPTQESGYKAVTLIVQNQDEYQKLLAMAYADLAKFKARYSALTELEEIMALI